MGWTSLVNDAASELLYPVLPLYLVVTLHRPALVDNLERLLGREGDGGAGLHG